MILSRKTKLNKCGNHINDHSMEGSAKFIKGENKVNLLAKIDLVDLLRILKWFSSSAYLLISNFSALNFVML